MTNLLQNFYTAHQLSLSSVSVHLHVPTNLFGKPNFALSDYCFVSTLKIRNKISLSLLLPLQNKLFEPML